MAETEKAWVAVIIDGEGSLAISRVRPLNANSSPRYQLLVSVSNTSVPMLIHPHPLPIVSLGFVSKLYARCK